MAKYTVGFEAYAMGHSQVKRNRIEGKFNIFVCESHKDGLNTDELITAGGWERIQSCLLSLGRALLDRRTAKLTFEDVSSHL